jgi:hypothetical protein
MKKYIGLILIALYPAFAPACFMGMNAVPHTAQTPHAMRSAHQEEPASATPIQTIAGHQEMYQSVTSAVFFALLSLTLPTLAALLSGIYRYVVTARRKRIVLSARSPGRLLMQALCFGRFGTSRAHRTSAFSRSGIVGSAFLTFAFSRAEHHYIV